MKLKIYGCWITYNAMPTLLQSMLSIRSYVDEIVVIDGDFEGNQSNDGTWELVELLKKDRSFPPITHLRSQEHTLFDKHNEHVRVTGNNDPNVWTWQVDSDEIYLPENAHAIYEAIMQDKSNGIGVKLYTINIYDDKGNCYCSQNIEKEDTTQMRVYRMCNGLHFRTQDGIFEHILYGDETQVQRQDNKILYDTSRFKVFNYHCFSSHEEDVNRYAHYGESDPEKTASSTKDKDNNKMLVERHPLMGVRWNLASIGAVS